MLALQCFISDLERGDETCADMMPDEKHFILCFRKRNVLYKMLGLGISPCYAVTLSMRGWTKTWVEVSCMMNVTK